MAVVDAPSQSPPTPAECAHPGPVLGVMANEYSHYADARGPEGPRRTTTFYGPVIGGLPIEAWHCEKCGLLRLGYPDGRKEERRLYPGPQPGLLAMAAVVSPEVREYGMQARVSGLSISPALAPLLDARPAARRARRLPAWGTTGWATVVLLGAVFLGLFLAGFGAVYTYSTPEWEGPLVLTLAGLFAAWLVLVVGTAAYRHFLPADPRRVRPPMDAATIAVVTLLSLVTAGLLVIGLLAVYTYSTPGAVGPLALGAVVLVVLALLTVVITSARRRRSRG